MVGVIHIFFSRVCLEVMLPSSGIDQYIIKKEQRLLTGGCTVVHNICTTA